MALLFIDGVGIGRRDPAVNPLAREGAQAHLLARFLEDGLSPSPIALGGVATSLETTFGIPGRPQSASNQTAILTGLPAPKLTGKHVLGFPDAPLRALLSEHALPRRLLEEGLCATFANAYPAGYLDALGLSRRPSENADVVIPERARRRIRPSATTLAMAAGQVALRTLDDARRGEGLTHDIHGGTARGRGFGVPERSPDEAAAIFWRIAAEADFTLFEHYLADEAGHAQDFAAAAAALQSFEDFTRAVAQARPPHAHVLVCSDHGNVEDLSTRSHTLHRVPALYFGPSAADVVPRLHTVADIGRVVLHLLGVGVSGARE